MNYYFCEFQLKMSSQNWHWSLEEKAETKLSYFPEVLKWTAESWLHFQPDKWKIRFWHLCPEKFFLVTAIHVGTWMWKKTNGNPFRKFQIKRELDSLSGKCTMINFISIRENNFWSSIRKPEIGLHSEVRRWIRVREVVPWRGKTRS